MMFQKSRYLMRFPVSYFFYLLIDINQRGLARPKFVLLGDGAIALGENFALLPSRVKETSVPRSINRTSCTSTSVLMLPRQREG